MARGIQGFFKKKKEKPQKSAIIHPQREEKEERIFDVVEKDGQTNVLFRSELIFTHSEQNPAVNVIIAEKKEETDSVNGVVLSIIKKIPLKKAYTSVTTSSCSLLFSEKGYSVDLKIFQKGEKLVYNVKTNQKNKIIQLNVPRETISIKYGYPQVKEVERPFYIEAGAGLVEFPEASERKEKKIVELSEYNLSHCNGTEGIFEKSRKKQTKNRKSKRKTVELNQSKPVFKTVVPAFYDGNEHFIKVNSAGWWKIVFNKRYYSFHSMGDRFQIVKSFDSPVENIEQELNILYLSSEKLKSLIEERGKGYRALRSAESMAVLPSNETLDSVYQAVSLCKKHGIKIAVSIIPFSSEKLPQEFFVKTENEESYSFTENGNRYFALDLTKEDVCTYVKNQARALLNSGANALVAERAQLNLCQFCLYEEFTEQALRWSEYWQRLFPEVVREYPNVTYYTRHNSLNSPRYGIPLND